MIECQVGKLTCVSFLIIILLYHKDNNNNFNDNIDDEVKIEQLGLIKDM